MKCDTPEPPGLWGLQLGGRLGGRTCQSELKKAETTTPAERSRIEEDRGRQQIFFTFLCVRSPPPPRPSCVTAKQVSLSFHTSTQTHMFSIRPRLRTNFLFFVLRPPSSLGVSARLLPPPLLPLPEAEAEAEANKIPFRTLPPSLRSSSSSSSSAGVPSWLLPWLFPRTRCRAEETFFHPRDVE